MSTENKKLFRLKWERGTGEPPTAPGCGLNRTGWVPCHKPNPALVCYPSASRTNPSSAFELLSPYPPWALPAFRPPQAPGKGSHRLALPLGPSSERGPAPAPAT